MELNQSKWIGVMEGDRLGWETIRNASFHPSMETSDEHRYLTLPSVGQTGPYTFWQEGRPGRPEISGGPGLLKAKISFEATVLKSKRMMVNYLFTLFHFSFSLFISFVKGYQSRAGK